LSSIPGFKKHVVYHSEDVRDTESHADVSALGQEGHEHPYFFQNDFLAATPFEKLLFRALFFYTSNKTSNKKRRHRRSSLQIKCTCLATVAPGKSLVQSHLQYDDE
jgi:hypothetical protein